MDIKSIEPLLSEIGNYQTYTKKTFLEGLETLFAIFKANGDTELIPVSGKCAATAEECDNCGKAGRAYTGNNTGNYFALIIKDNGSSIDDVSECFEFNFMETFPVKGERIKIPFISQKEKQFKATTEYKITTHECDEAVNEIYEKELSINDCRNWLSKHKLLYDELPRQMFMDLKELDYLKSLYHPMNTLIVFIDRATKAVSDINSTSNKLLPGNLIDYQDLNNQIKKFISAPGYASALKETHFPLSAVHSQVMIESESFKLLHQYCQTFKSYSENLHKTPKKELLIQAISKMDISMVHFLLKDKPYMDVSKNVFLKRLERKFDYFKAMGDMELSAHKVECGGEACIGKCGEVFAFVGMSTKAYLSLRFEEQKGKFHSISYCEYNDYNDKSTASSSFNEV
jgi:hypothetical protein